MSAALRCRCGGRCPASTESRVFRLQACVGMSILAADEDFLELEVR